jgi:PAS domain S-box-containing protein
MHNRDRTKEELIKENSLLMERIHELEISGAEHIRTIEALKDKEEQLRDTSEKIPGVIYQFYAKPDGILGLNYVSERVKNIFGLDNNPHDFFQRFSARVAPESINHFIESITDAVNNVKPWRYEGRFIKDNGDSLWFQGLSNPVKRGREIVFNGVLLDVTERKRAEHDLLLNSKRTDALLQLGQMAVASLKEITDFTLEKAVELTESKIGYLAFLNKDESVLTMHSWSKTAMKECTVSEKPVLYNVVDTGLWGEAVRQRKPIITNDYAADNLWKKGYPEGHVKVFRHMNVPIFDGNKIVIVAGVGNKEPEYSETDIQQLTLLMQGMWQLLKRRQAEEESERLAMIVKHSRDLVNLAAPDGSMLFLNEAGRNILGLSEEDVVNVKIMDVIPESFKNRVRQEVMPVIERNGYWEGDLQYHNLKTDSPMDVHAVAFKITDPDTGALKYYANVSQDITERKKIEKALQDSESNLRSIFRVAPIGIGLVSDRIILRANNRLCEMIGYEREELIGKSARILYPTDEEFNYVGREKYIQISAHGTGTVETKWICRNGSIIDILLSSTPIDTTNLKAGVTFTALDITARKQAERKLQYAYEQIRATGEQMRAQYESLVESERSLRESEGKYRRLTETAHDVIISVDLNFKITYVNQSFLNLAGDSNPVGLSLLDFTPPHLHELQKAIMEKRREGFSDVLTFEWDMNLPTGKKAVFDIRGTLITEDEIPAGVLFVARDITERKRAEDELRRLSTAIEQAAEDIVITDPEGLIQYVNPAFEKITGYSKVEAIGRKPSILKSGIHDTAFYENLWNTIKEGSVWTGHIINRRKDGNLIYEDATISPLLTSKGELTGYVSLKRDVTDAVKLEFQLRQAQKMEAIGTLAGGIAHDFNNILGAMMGYAELARLRIKDEKAYSYLDQILQACDRARDLVKQILTFSRQSEPEKKPIVLIPLIKEVVKFMRSSLPATIAIEQKITASSDVVMADATQMHQLLMNLCMNAGHAMKGKGGLLEITAEDVSLEGHESQHDSLPKGRYLHLAVRDTGSGIEARHLGKIFEPYFTTKKQGEGTGLGLSVVDGIVKSHGGEIKVYSEVGRGTVFHVYLPLIGDKTDKIFVKEIETLPGGRETILFVDDEKMLAHANKLALEELGYKVVAETDPGIAIEAFHADRDGFDIVITDKTMPHMTGFDLVKVIKGIRNDIPVIICSGFQDKEDAAKMAALGISSFIAKPIKLSEMSRIIRDVLDTKRG